ncbi:hypothetical protein ACFQ45_09520 [Rhodanobacter aciditrophus]|uniref:VWFA domain-containing protein n=1 Tax=Rhodanobacter aciditrophus TaxID=1623218 RepID=A0ABW4B2Z3_9GAMM
MVIRKSIVSYIVLLLLLMAPLAKADTQFRLIVDASGSMLISDPDKLTAESLKLISDLAPEESASLGVWLFGERPRVLFPEAMVNPSTKADLQEAINSYVPGDLKTDLESIVRLLSQTPDLPQLQGDINRHWILVTDGMVDISLDEAVNEASRERITSELAAGLAEKGVHLHTVSMTGYTDKELLQSVSNLTDATHTEVATPEDLLDTFDRIFSQASPSEEVPFEGNQFFIDDAIEEATLLVFHQEGVSPVIRQPGGTLLPMSAANVSSVEDTHYTLVTVTKPKVGTWEVENVDLERSNVRVITKLSAQATKVAPVLFVNEPIYSTVGLFQDGQLIDDQEFLNLVDVTQRLQLLSGETEKQILNTALPIANNQFKNKVEQLTSEGNYELISEVDGKTFVRKLSQYFAVTAPISVEVERQSDNLVLFSAKPTNMRLNPLRSNARLVLSFSDGSEETVEMPLIGEGYWQKIYPVPPSNVVSAYVRLVGITRTGVRFDYESENWTLSRQGAEPVSVSRGNADNSPELAAVAAVNRDLMPVVVTPQFSVVEPDQIEEPAPADEEVAQEAPELTPEEELAAENEAILNKQDWILYGVLNGAVILVLVGGYLVFRRIRNKRKQQAIDEIDV